MRPVASAIAAATSAMREIDAEQWYCSQRASVVLNVPPESGLWPMLANQPTSSHSLRTSSSQSESRN
jgi:hypothetical protein